MNLDRWQEIKSQIKDKFNILDKGEDYLEEEGGVTIEYIVFITPIGKVRLEFISKPTILDKKVIYSNRVGSETKIDYIYSKNEKTEQLNAYRWDEAEEDWEEIEFKGF